MTATRRHGTRAMYVAESCRCGPCTAANRVYASHRNRAQIYGRWSPYVDAGAVRAHLDGLAAAGIGLRRVTHLSGVSRSNLTRILHGSNGRPPTARVRRETAEAILAVSAAPAPGALVPATGTHRRIQALVAAGWSIPRLARQLGMLPSNLHTLLTRDQVIARTATAAAELYDQLWGTRPDESTTAGRASATRARRYAAARGWPPPLAWDDADLDDPAAAADHVVAAPRRAARAAAVLEDAEELARCGVTLAEAAARFTIQPESLERLLARHGRGDILARFRGAVA